MTGEAHRMAKIQKEKEVREGVIIRRRNSEPKWKESLNLTGQLERGPRQQRVGSKKKKKSRHEERGY